MAVRADIQKVVSVPPVIFILNGEGEAVRGFEFEAPLHKVWDVMHEVEDSEARVR
jgi:hypothetical protein